MTEADGWHTDVGFVGSEKGIALHVIDADRGIVDMIPAPVPDDTPRRAAS